MKKLLSAVISISMVFSLFGCDKAMTFDNEYGVRYLLNEDNFITIHLDPNDSRTITMITIVSTDELYGNGENLDEYPDDSDSEANVIYNRNDYQEFIRIRFYNGISSEELSAISQYLNFSFATKTDIHDLLDSRTFFYRKILSDGEFINDISFSGNHKVTIK